ncbi:MAG: DUF4065 domain-containing protein [Hormoscilla sp. GUM202]|nr:DUF4065 domain-containing protein [Hormoscilla sp. GUM202]
MSDNATLDRPDTCSMKTITTAGEIADYFIWVANDTGSFISNLKLQKLVYYAQAWHLAIHDSPLFEDDFEAWVHGPVIPALFEEYKKFQWKPIIKEVKQPQFSPKLEEFLEEITGEYFLGTGLELEIMVCREDPWIKARKGLPRDEPSHAIISQESMREFYKSRAVEATTITTASEIADYFIWVANDTGSFISNLKLQKLVYYAQAWHLAIHDTPLFEDDFEAWAPGPTIPTLFEEYKKFQWKPILKQVKKPQLPQAVEDFLAKITEEYFTCNAFELEIMVHREDPWLKARRGLLIAEHSDAIISKESMREYYKNRAA